MATLDIPLQMKQGLAAGLPTGLAGEWLFTTDTHKMYYGDGTTNYGPVILEGDSRLADSRTPTGSAGGDLTGTYPNPTIGAAKVTTSKIADANVTLAKVANAGANSVLLGSGATGSGSAYVEISLGSGLAMTGTTLSASGSGGTVSSVDVAVNNGITVSGNPITTSGTLTFGLGNITPTQCNPTLTNGTTSSSDSVLAVTHNSTGTPAAGFGAICSVALQDSTTAGLTAYKEEVTWVDATHATRKARVVFSAYDASPREFLRGESSGLAAKVGFLGAAAAAVQAGDAGTALVTFGLMSGTPTFAAANLTGVVAVNQGGTGQTTYTDGQLLIGNTTGNTLTKATLTAPAAGLTITNGHGSITFALANDLAALEGLSGTNTIYYRSGVDTWSAVAIGSNLSFSGGTLSATGSGNVTGPGSSTDKAVARFSGTGGTTIQNSAMVVADDGSTTVTMSDAATTAQSTVTTVAHLTSGTAGVGFGAIQYLDLQTSTGAQQHAYSENVQWVDATNGTRKAAIIHRVHDVGGAETYLSAEATGSGAKIGFLGATNAGVQTGDAGAALVTFGLMSGTPTFAAANLTGTTLASSVVTSSLTTVGTIGTGTWHGTKIGLLYGGTNADLSATGGAHNFLKQDSAGAAITVGTIGAADIAAEAWTTFTPTITAQTGTPTATSATGRYIQFGKVVICQMDITITTAGTASSSLKATLPVNSASNIYVGSVYEYGVSGKCGAAVILGSSGSQNDQTHLWTRDATGATWWANGNKLAITIVYEAS